MNSRKIVACAVFNLWALRVFAQYDSLVKFSDLVFVTGSEREAFAAVATRGIEKALPGIFLTHYKNRGSDVWKPSVAVESAVHTLAEETAGMKDDKKVKYIFSYVQKRFLKAYDFKNCFLDVFSNGAYNCVSGSALYAVIFTKLNIPFQVKEEPQHVYLVAYPGQQRLLIESTNPQKGYIQFNEQYMQKFAEYLRDNKYISESEYGSKPAKTLFNDFYFRADPLGISELAAIQYCNFSLYLEEEEDLAGALEQMKKAYYLWPCEKFRYMLRQFVSRSIYHTPYKTSEQVKPLAMLCRMQQWGKRLVSDELLKNEYRRVMSEFLINNPDSLKMQKARELVTASVKDTTLRRDLEFDYFFEMARQGYNKNRSAEYELKLLKAAYTLNPRHEDLRNMILMYFAKVVEKSRDVKNVLIQTERFTAQFDFLAGEKELHNVRANCLLELAFEHNTLGEINKGGQYLDNFEKHMKEFPSSEPNEFYIEKAYATAASYYYKKGNASLSRQLLKRGLSYAPGNFGLKQRLTQAR